MWQSLKALSTCDDLFLSKQDLYDSELALAKLNDRICLTLCDGRHSRNINPRNPGPSDSQTI